jgi:hypothetical protein
MGKEFNSSGKQGEKVKQPDVLDCGQGRAGKRNAKAPNLFFH